MSFVKSIDEFDLNDSLSMFYELKDSDENFYHSKIVNYLFPHRRKRFSFKESSFFLEKEKIVSIKHIQNTYKITISKIVIIAIVLLCFPPSSDTLNLEQCKDPIGMESGNILDEQISASSSHEVSVTGPVSARLNVDRLGGAWCPRGMVGEEHAKHYLEINLKKAHVISAAVTQGRFGNGRGVEYVEHYLLEYWREGFKEWKTYKLYNGSKILKGNLNTYTAVSRELMPPVHASKIRFIPHANHPRTVCMRVEVVGCPYKDGLVSYSMPQGEERGQDLELIDSNYDGEVKDGFLTGGHGQLTDGIIGDSNFRANLTRGKGYEWIGWKNESYQPLEMVFEFDALRNFTAIYIYANNMFSKDVQVFSRARVWFGLDRFSYNSRPIEYYYMKDDVSEYARNVTISLRGRVARNLKIQLFYASKWIMISEIFFSSFPIYESGNSVDFPSNVDKVAFGGGFSTNGDGGNRDIYTDLSGFLHNDLQAPDLRINQVPETEADGKRQQLIAIIIGILVAVIFMLTAAIFYFFWNTKRHKMNCLPQDLFRGPFGHRQEIVRLQIETENDTEVPKNTIYAEPFQTAYRGSFSTVNTSHRVNASLRMSSPDYTDYVSTDYAVPHEVQRVMEYGSQRAPSPYFSSFLGKDLQSASANGSPLHRSFNGSVSGNSNPTQNNFDVDAYKPLETSSHGNFEVYCEEQEMCPSPIEPQSDYFPPEIPKQKINVLRQLGEGDFGEVHLGEMEYDDSGRKRLVAIKSLRMEASFVVRAGFEREVSILARLQNRNIVRVIGVCTTEEPLCMLSEFGEKGDLNHFLQGHVATTSSTKATNAKTVSYGCLIYMATQIASGMKYLESLNFVHRDLATRNCLVCSDYSIKISDFGMSRQIYRGDYFLTEGSILMPVRWMAWESILLGKYTTKSDVWAFGVTLWEVLTMARERPLDDLTDEQVIENANYLYQTGLKKETPFQPPNCPKEIFDLMKECWKHSEDDRPTFREIHMFLQRKNLGYSLSL